MDYSQIRPEGAESERGSEKHNITHQVLKAWNIEMSGHGNTCEQRGWECLFGIGITRNVELGRDIHKWRINTALQLQGLVRDLV